MSIDMPRDPIGEFASVVHRMRLRTAIYDQDKQWRTGTGEMVDIAAMEPEHRLNTVLMLMRNAALVAQQYEMGWSWYMAVTGAPDDVCAEADREDEQRSRDPQGWLLSTRLVRALIAELPTDALEFAMLERRAKHWPTCPIRQGDIKMPCTCGAQPAAMGDWRVRLMYAIKQYSRS